ncbi:hypothetical protein BB561_001779 [Smittium simulii]|uniref:Uncharacterized protein n=1 Tax=Smittium simulii TaxID=133385 RepID=A0A2T9YT95_9FUNG|nr:hypothetical protein BB561_001779 [Smittium simulii]
MQKHKSGKFLQQNLIQQVIQKKRKKRLKITMVTLEGYQPYLPRLAEAFGEAIFIIQATEEIPGPKSGNHFSPRTNKWFLTAYRISEYYLINTLMLVKANIKNNEDNEDNDENYIPKLSSFSDLAVVVYSYSKKLATSKVTQIVRENITSHQQPNREYQYSLYGKRTVGRPANASYESDFFRSPIFKEERKENIYECPKFLGMKYTPPPHNKAATPAICKNNLALYRIQMTVANITRPIDDYVHKKLKDPASRIKGNNDLKINNLHKSMEIPGRLGALLAAKKPIAISRKNKRSSLCQRQQTASGTTSAMAQTPHNATPNTDNNDQTTQSREGIQNSVQESESREAKGFDKEKLYKSDNLWPTTHSSSTSIQEKNKKKSQLWNNQGVYRRPTSSSRPLETQQLCRGEEFQNVISDIHAQDDQEKGLYDLSESRGRFFAHSDTSEVQEISSQAQGKMYGEYKEIILQTKPAGVQDQDGEVQYDTISINYSSGDNNKLTSYEFKSFIRQDKGSQTRGQQTDQSWQDNTEKLGKLYWKGTSNSSNAKETIGIEKQFFKKIKIIYCNETTEIEIFTNASNTAWRIVVGSSQFRIVASIDNISPHKRQGIISSVLRATTSQCCWSLGISLFRQHYDPSIRTEIWGNHLSQITRSLRKTVVSLYRDKHTPSDVLCTNVHQPGRRAIKTDCSNRMIFINRDIHETEQDIWLIRRGSV